MDQYAAGEYVPVHSHLSLMIQLAQSAFDASLACFLSASSYSSSYHIDKSYVAGNIIIAISSVPTAFVTHCMSTETRC
jgi:hypothetical protein